MIGLRPLLQQILNEFWSIPGGVVNKLFLLVLYKHLLLQQMSNNTWWKILWGVLGERLDLWRPQLVHRTLLQQMLNESGLILWKGLQ